MADTARAADTSSLDALLARFANRDRAALSRLISLAARGQHLAAIRAAVRNRGDSSRVVAITGSTGVGKSSLIGKLAEHLRSAGRSVAVLACDPQSPITGGALLGDRVRMPTRPDDPDIYIRSLASQSGQQGLAEHVDVILRLLAAFGFDVIVLETTGAGQGDTAVRDLADVVVLLVQPESGDAIQWEKAGLAEVADIVVIHKADLPGAGRLEAELKEEAQLQPSQAAKIVRVSSTKGEGLAELWNAIAAHQSRVSSNVKNAASLLHLAQQLLAERLHKQPERFASIVNKLAANQISDTEAAEQFLNIGASNSPDAR